MGVGAFKTLDQFGWISTQSPSAQRANVQNAFDSGEPLLMPAGETVQIDSGLVINHPLHLMGHGSDITNTGISASQFECVTSGIDALTILAHNCILKNFGIQIDSIGGRGIVIGDGVHVVFGSRLEGISTSSNFSKGVEILSGQEESFVDCNLSAQDAAISINDQVSADEGDRRIRGGELNAYNYLNGGQGACILLASGGGLICEGGTKFLNAYYHVKVNWLHGGSGGLVIQGCSLENCHGAISIDMDGTQPFTRAVIANNSFGNASVAVVVRNFRSSPWINSLVVANNVIDVGGPYPCMDFGSVGELFVHGNTINGGNIATSGITIRNPATGCIGINTIRNINGPAISRPDGNTAVTQSPFQG